MDTLCVKQLNLNYIDDIIVLQNQVFSDLGENTHFLRRNTRQTFERCLMDPNVTMGVFDENQLVGLAILENTLNTPEYMSVHNKPTIYLKLYMIRKQYYGKGFQKYIISKLERIAYNRGYEYMIVTVSPDNIHSKNNLLSYGFVYDRTETKYGGLLRDILYKKVRLPK